MSIKKQCPVCNLDNNTVFFELENMPAHIGLLWENYESAVNCSKGDIKLAFCRSCGLIWNIVFDPKQLEYSQAYDNSLHFSDVYNDYARAQAKQLIERYKVNHKTVIDIGCGKGDFLIMLCELGDNKGVGFDVSYEHRKGVQRLGDQINFIRDFYSEKYAYYHGDLICSRYVLEHIDKPIDFLRTIRRSIGDRLDTVVYFEVPDVYLILEALSVWDVIYEHYLYFCPASLVKSFELSGFCIKKVSETYQNQFIAIEVFPGDDKTTAQYDITDDLARITEQVDTFSSMQQRKNIEWLETIDDIEKNNKRAMIWGAGAKGVGFLNVLNVKEAIPYAVDINPNKHGKYVAGTGQKIVPPEFVTDYQPDVIIVMNSIYKREIENTLEKLDVGAELIIQ